jgi:hypothetical protein
LKAKEQQRKIGKIGEHFELLSRREGASKGDCCPETHTLSWGRCLPYAEIYKEREEQVTVSSSSSVGRLPGTQRYCTSPKLAARD